MFLQIKILKIKIKIIKNLSQGALVELTLLTQLELTSVAMHIISFTYAFFIYIYFIHVFTQTFIRKKDTISIYKLTGIMNVKIEVIIQKQLFHILKSIFY